MIIKFCLVIFTILFGISNAEAFKIADIYCNNQVKKGEWLKGTKDRKKITNLINEFDAEHKETITFLDSIPVKIPEKEILTGMIVKPISVIRVIENSVSLRWEVPGKNSNLFVIIDQYKGCVDTINIMSTDNMVFYRIENILSRNP